MATYHSIRSGTDASHVVFRLVALASVNVVTFLTIVLILAARKAALAKHGGKRRTAEPAGV